VGMGCSEHEETQGLTIERFIVKTPLSQDAS